jgi:hypothetical protein
MNIVEYVSGDRRYRATIVPGKHIIVECFRDGQFVSMRKFEVGDVAEYDSYNLSYTAPIVAIGKSTVTFKVYDSRRRLKAENFAWRNWDFNAAEIARRNAVISQCI